MKVAGGFFSSTDKHGGGSRIGTLQCIERQFCRGISVFQWVDEFFGRAVIWRILVLRPASQQCRDGRLLLAVLRRSSRLAVTAARQVVDKRQPEARRDRANLMHTVGIESCERHLCRIGAVQVKTDFTSR